MVHTFRKIVTHTHARTHAQREREKKRERERERIKCAYFSSSYKCNKKLLLHCMYHNADCQIARLQREQLVYIMLTACRKLYYTVKKF